MPNVAMQPVVQLAPGARIAAKFLIDSPRVSHWRYGKECPARFAPVSPGTVLRVFEVQKAFPSWVKAYLPHTHDTAHLKISGEELALNFLLVQ